MNRDELKVKVNEYVEKNPNKTDQEIAEAVGVPLVIVMDVLLTLEREGAIQCTSTTEN